MTTTYTVPHWQKRLTSKMKVPCPDVIKMYYKGMGGVDVIDQGPPAFHLDQKSTHRFYLHVFFNLMDAACANSYIVYNMIHLNDRTLPDCKTIVSAYLIGRYKSRSRARIDGKGSKESISISLGNVT